MSRELQPKVEAANEGVLGSPALQGHPSDELVLEVAFVFSPLSVARGGVFDGSEKQLHLLHDLVLLNATETAKEEDHAFVESGAGPVEVRGTFDRRELRELLGEAVDSGERSRGGRDAVHQIARLRLVARVHSESDHDHCHECACDTPLGCLHCLSFCSGGKCLNSLCFQKLPARMG